MCKRITARPLLYSLPALLLLLALSSCEKKQIQFGNDLNESDTRLISIDTVKPILSTLVLDSFPTSNTSLLLIGRSEDPLLGTTNARTYFQLGLPTKSTITDDLPNDAIYDSLVLLLTPNAVYYGDTTKAQTFSVYELAYQPEYTYADQLYNTSSIRQLPNSLGSATLLVRPARKDSLRIRLSQSKGAELFSKIKTKGSEIQSEANFLSYLKGLSVQVSNTDNGAIYSFGTGDSSVRVRLYYHVSLPYPESREIEFPLTRTAYQFNQVATDRSNTAMKPQYAGQKEFPTSKAYPYAFTQAGTGVLMKIKFPSLREILKLSETIRLLDAQLIIRPVQTSFNEAVFPLPPSLYLSETDGTNSIGYPIPDLAGTGTQYSAPIFDVIYRENTRYIFNLTAYINYLLSTANSAENGVFLMEEHPGEAKLMNRAVMGSWEHPQYRTELVLKIMTID